LEAIDIGRCVIYGGVVCSGVWATVWDGDEGVTAGIGEARANTAKAVSWNAIFKQAGRFGREILVATAHTANGDQVYARVGSGGGKKQRQQKWDKISSSHDKVSS
jgi:hypothetical protein